MPVHKCPNGKYRIGSGPCNFTSKEKAERAYAAYRAKKHDDTLHQGKYYNCVSALKYYGMSEEEAELACIKFLIDKDDDIIDADETTGEDSIEEVIDLRTRMDLLKDSHPNWNHEEILAGAEAYEGIKIINDEIEMANIISRSRSLSLAKFSRLIKEVKTRLSLKAPHMGILPQRVFLPMKNLNRLQTKLEKVVTQESKWLTSEQYEQRKQYARYMRKTDSEDEPMTNEEFTDAINDLSLSIMEHFPSNTQEEAIDLAFGPPIGDNAWILSNEAEIVSMNDGLNNIIKAPIILAKEMVQSYQVKDEETGKVHTEYHFKSFEELQDAADRFGYDSSLDIIIEHQDWYATDNIMGVVKQIHADLENKSLRGMGYFYENRLPKGLKEHIKSGETIPVSIGFLAKLGEGGFWNGVKYDHVQKNILLRHLAICLDSIPRCPKGVCGINLEDAEDKDNIKIFSIIKKPNYYINICTLFKDSETETNNESSIKKKEENQTMQGDSEGKLKVEGETSDLEAILQRLRKMINDEGWTEELRSTAISRILSALGVKQKSDNTMDETKFKDAIAIKDSEIEDLKVKLEDASKKIAKFEEEKRKNLISKIKKFGDKYSDEELSNKDLSALEMIADAVSRFEPSEEKPEVLPVPPQTDKVELSEKLKGEKIDFSKVFEHVNKEFGME